jgi:hypothetical protein
LAFPPKVGRATHDITDAVCVERLQESKLRRPKWSAKTAIGIQQTTTGVVRIETFNRCKRFHVPNDFSDEDLGGRVGQGDSATLPARRPHVALLREILYDLHQVTFGDSMRARYLLNRRVQALPLRKVNQSPQRVISESRQLHNKLAVGEFISTIMP